jgi:hypothetical protein
VLRLRAFELIETGNRRSRRDARQPFAHEHRVRAYAVFAQHVCEMAFVRIDTVAVCFEAHPSAQHEFGQLVARRAGKRRRRIEPAADLRSVDAQKAHAPDRGHVDRVAVDDRAHQHWVRTPQGGGRSRCLT